MSLTKVLHYSDASTEATQTKCLAQEHNTFRPSGLNPTPISLKEGRSRSRPSARMNESSEWKLPLRGQITYRHCRQPKLPYFLYSSNRLFGGGAADAGNAAKTFFFSVPAISKLTTLTVESLWTAPSESAKHHIMAIDEAS